MKPASLDLDLDAAIRQLPFDSLVKPKTPVLFSNRIKGIMSLEEHQLYSLKYAYMKVYQELLQWNDPDLLFQYQVRIIALGIWIKDSISTRLSIKHTEIIIIQKDFSIVSMSVLSSMNSYLN